MCVFKYHAFIFLIRPPRWQRETITVLLVYRCWISWCSIRAVVSNILLCFMCGSADIMVLQVWRCWISWCYICLSAGYYDASCVLQISSCNMLAGARCVQVLDIIVLHVCRCWISKCFMCVSAGYHGTRCEQVQDIMVLHMCWCMISCF